MSMEETEPQVGHQRRLARELSLQRARPPAVVPGYEPERFLGVGAYGEVWVAVERNTGRRVAIKFYTHRGGLDWSLLSREVEKLAFLFADRYVVQLLGVGWDADPPYYIMEYLEKGSLAERIQHGPLPVEQAVALFEDVALGLVHAHNKGVLHCDLKPANILLDEDDGRGWPTSVSRVFRPNRRPRWERFSTWRPSRPTWRPCPMPAGTFTPWERCCTAC